MLFIPKVFFLNQIFFHFANFLFYIGIELVYNVVIVSSAQQRGSVTRIPKVLMTMMNNNCYLSSINKLFCTLCGLLHLIYTATFSVLQVRKLRHGDLKQIFPRSHMQKEWSWDSIPCLPPS